MLIEKPSAGDFLPLLDGGFGLQYSPLLEYREGSGMVLFCQLDVTGRTESDPAATRLVRNLLDYVASWKPASQGQLLYVGDPAGKRHLEQAGLCTGRLPGPVARTRSGLGGGAREAGKSLRPAPRVLPRGCRREAKCWPSGCGPGRGECIPAEKGG